MTMVQVAADTLVFNQKRSHINNTIFRKDLLLLLISGSVHLRGKKVLFCKTDSNAYLFYRSNSSNVAVELIS